MSDLFVAQILVYILLLPVLVRPFVRSLQWIKGIPVLPLLALLLCTAVVAANGLPVVFLPTLLCTSITFFVGLSRLLRLFRRLPTDWFSSGSRGVHVLLCLGWLAAVGTSFSFSSEPAYLATKLVSRNTLHLRLSPGVFADVVVWTPDAETEVKGLVYYAGGPLPSSSLRPTMGAIMAENGFVCIAADYRSFRDWDNPLWAYSGIRYVAAVFERATGNQGLLPSKAALDAVHSLDFFRFSRLASLVVPDVYRRIISERSLPLYLVLEGSAVSPGLNDRQSTSLPFAGTICLGGDASSAVTESVRIALSTTLPALSASVPVMIVDELTLPGFGELTANDPLAARLMGLPRDALRKEAERTARRVVSWLLFRDSHLATDIQIVPQGVVDEGE